MGLDMYIFKNPRGEHPTWESEVAYWRKANAIHKFFVDTVQDGIDDCEFHHEVTKEVINSLATRCDLIIDKVKLVPGTVTNGYRLVDGKMEPCLEPGYLVDDESICKELLPSEEGFFFGSTDYNQWYYQDIKDTYCICRNLLKTINFETEALYYCSSW